VKIKYDFRGMGADGDNINIDYKEIGSENVE
jgi:hypothetical protein